MNPGDRTVQRVDVLGVREILDIEDLQFPILLSQGDDAESVVVDPGVANKAHGRGLRGPMVKRSGLR